MWRTVRILESDDEDEAFGFANAALELLGIMNYCITPANSGRAEKRSQRTYFKIYRVAIIVGSFLWGAVTTCNADVLIDAIHVGFGPTGGINDVTVAPLGQSFTADTSNIIWIGMEPGTANITGLPGYSPIEFQMNLLNGAGTGGTLVATETATAQLSGTGFVYFNFTGTVLVVGDIYTAIISQLTSGTPSQPDAQISLVTSDVYSGGMAFFAGQPEPDDDFFFRVLSTEEIPPETKTPEMPLPAAFPLFATGLGAMGLLGWRRKRKNAAAAIAAA